MKFLEVVYHELIFSVAEFSPGISVPFNREKRVDTVDDTLLSLFIARFKNACVFGLIKLDIGFIGFPEITGGFD